MDHGPDNEPFWPEGARHAHDDWWGWPLHLIFFILVLALLVAGAVWLVRRLTPAVAQAAVPAGATAPVSLAVDPAVATVRMRYAKGEISRDDFRHVMEDLTGVAASTAAWPGGEPDEGTTPTAG